MGVRRAMALISDTKQVTGEGKNGPVKTGLTRGYGPASVPWV